MPRLLRVLMPALAGFTLALSAHATDSNMGESSEIAFCNGGTAPYAGCIAADLRLTADSLASPAAIFEYLRNNYDYSLYHGARSGSVNTFLGGRGNEVDLAATLIAMLRSQGVPARYVVGAVRVLPSQVANWLQVEDTTLAKSLLIDQGIQGVVSSTSGSTPTFDFEHVWVEALVPYDMYRGGNVSTTNCVATPGACHWVPMDPSWKQYKQVNSGLDPYTALSFDYTSYYDAILNGDNTRVNKNPLEIYQEQVLAWLGTAAPGKTLEDIPDFQGIITETDGLLPASLPYAVASSATRSYNSVADHDAVVPAAESKKWAKQTRLTTKIVNGGVTLQAGAGTTLLTDTATQRLTIATNTVGSTTSVIVRLGGATIATPITVGGMINGHVIAIGDPFTIEVSMDGPPDPTGGGNDTTITATYQAVIGGYYLVATGGETSNWSQVHRAAQQLLAASTQYPVVVDGSQNAYVDTNGNGVYDAGVDTPLANNLAAMDALSGGLLYVAATQYYAKLKDDFVVADRLNKIKTPISGFLGVVSSTYQPAEYINSTAFGILPSGLLIDMKGIQIGGNWRINSPASAGVSNEQFAFIGHIVSSLEHETWQELTGYDAISTVRGIQMARANGAALVNPKKNSSTDTMAAAYAAFGFSNGSAPSGFTYSPFTMPFGSTHPATWTHATNGAAFDLMLAQISTATPALQQSWTNYPYSTNNGLYGWVSCVYSEATQLQGYVNGGNGNAHFTGTYTLCDGTPYSTAYSVSQIYAGLQTNYNNTVIPSYIGTNYFNYFDIAQGFAPASYVYRTTPIAADAQFTSLVATIRNNLYLQTLSQNWVEYLLPSKQSVGSNFKFAVDIRKVYDAPTGNLTSATFEILNNTGIAAGGGYVSTPPLATPRPVAAEKE